ncbi:hypothetical protein H0H92_009100 [Tricholoma furcatifolium]|nr:hypothetical protein H0H92_009100 [Tricholoma furcatifolium]
MMQHSSALLRRSRHGKRLPQDTDTGDSMDTPSADDSTTSVVVVTPTVTIFVFPSSLTDSTSMSATETDSAAIPTTTPDPDSSTMADDPTTSSVSSDSGYTVSSSTALYSVTTTSQVTSTTATADAFQTSTATVATAVSSSTTPIGAIVGVVLGILLLVAAGTGFWFRRRAVANRMKTRQWAKQDNDPSFLWLGPDDSAAKITPYRVVDSSMTQPSRDEESVNGGLVSQSSPRPSNNGLPFVPYPAPPRPPPAAGIYDLPAHSPGAATFTTLSPKTPSHVHSPFTPTHPLTVPSSPASSTLGETAKVRSTFVPTLPDELNINAGDMLRILSEYDDGWALCCNVRGEKGMVPLECLDKASQMRSPVTREYKKLGRTSSLAATTKAQYRYK